MNKKYLISLVSLGTLLTCGGFTTYKAVENHPVTYDLDGGAFTSENVVESVRWVDDVETPTAEKEHYVFKGWTDGNDTMTTIKHARNAVNLKAVYIPEIYDVSFMDGDTEISKTMYAYGIGVSDLGLFAKGNAENHPYEDFECWKDSDGNKVNSITETDFGDKVLTAYYKGKSYKITYDLYDGTADGLPETYTYGTGVDSLPEASKDGKIFDGWFSDEECTQRVTSISKDTHGDIHLYAQYHNAPVATTTRSSSGSYRSSGSGSYSSSASSSSSSASYDLSYGMHIPSIGYHASRVGTGYAYEAADCAGYDYLSYAYWANDSNNSFYKEEMISGEDHTGFHHVETSFLFLYDHASQGLSGAGWRMHAGDKVYFQGTEYTYSGRCDILSDYDSTTIFSNLSARKDLLLNGYRAVLKTCTEDNSANYVLYLY